MQPQEQVVPSLGEGEDQHGKGVNFDVGKAPSEPEKKGGNRKKTNIRRGPTALPKNRGTGFEEYFADPPLTPEEALEERNSVYSRSVTSHKAAQPLVLRIQACIQRFRSRRRLNQAHCNYLNEYLFLGGIDTFSKAFGGHDERDLKDLTPAERCDATAFDAVHAGSVADDKFYAGDREHWSVDFSGVMAGFLSTSLVVMTGGNREEMANALNLAENFLRYVLHHDVCPEYQDDVKRALGICGTAREEWPLLESLQHSLPGAFNAAAASLFTPPDARDWSRRGFTLPEGVDAKALFYTSCALLGELETIQSAQQGAIRVVKEYERTLKVVKVQQPESDIAARFGRLQVDGANYRFAPIGKAMFQAATIEDGWERPSVPGQAHEEDMWLYFEGSILANMKPGMKMRLSIVKLDTGIRYVKSVEDIVPSFYTFLPQLLMKHYQQQRVNERPAPSVQDPLAEEKQHAREVEGK
ncbi:hypothetical protein HIM_02961 [Hirsutella minnesotensis 3608]|nr:hypothetical protein HIM_02961 [Hirsutella minnesotensis 3608]